MQDRKLYTYNVPYVFSSTIQHKDSSRFEDNKLKDIILGIAPFIGSACRYAHSERGVGIYLSQGIDKIIPYSGMSFVFIQIKTTLLPCHDCIDFWSNKVKFSRDIYSEKFIGNFACDDGNTIFEDDFLQSLKQKCKIKKIGIGMNCSIQLLGDSIKSSNPFERFIGE